MPKLTSIWGNICTLSAEIILKAEYDTISKKVVIERQYDVNFR